MLDRTTARALVEAGYMPLREYMDMFKNEATRVATTAVVELGHHRSRQWAVPSRFDAPGRPKKHRNQAAA
jgi:hypothetical protein